MPWVYPSIPLHTVSFVSTMRLSIALSQDTSLVLIEVSISGRLPLPCTTNGGIPQPTPLSNRRTFFEPMPNLQLRHDLALGHPPLSSYRLSPKSCPLLILLSATKTRLDTAAASPLFSVPVRRRCDAQLLPAKPHGRDGKMLVAAYRAAMVAYPY